ncbi:MAG TPA: efflux RND transporter periplasmic adaptor subunit [Terriglobales bacterium]|nr:efflux RND transporter periplasmic adaptor subunit [Terriglobales bacterium]
MLEPVTEGDSLKGGSWVAATLVVLAAALLAGCSQANVAASMPAPPAQVKVLAVELRTVEDTSEYVATIKSRNSATIQPQVEGQITKIYVRSGEKVGAGAPLLEIDPLKQRATMNSSEATARQKQANLEWARTQLERTKKLYAARVVSKQDLDQAQTGYDAAQADLASLNAQVKEQQVQLQYYEVVAPSAGIVGDIPVHIGDRVTTSTMLTTVDRNTDLEAYIQVPLERATQLRLGLPVDIVSDTGAVLARSRITFISPQVDMGMQSVLVKALISNPRREIRSAQFVRARVVWSSHPGLMIPVTAVARISGQYFAFVAEQGPKGTVARQTPVQVGDITGSSYTVLAGIKPGDQVIVSGTQNLADGAPVAVVK